MVSKEFLVNHILSPFEMDRSFLTDTRKLLCPVLRRKSVLVWVRLKKFPLDLILSCFELLAKNHFCQIREIYECKFEGLIHPIHKKGKVKAFLISDLN